MIYALSDLHLALNLNKPMDKFGKVWKNHPIKIQQNWNNIITNDDLVLVSGDISWAMNMQDAKPDLEFIQNLNGNKILAYGNHDYWWNSTSKLNQNFNFNSIKFIKNDYYIYNNFMIYVIKGSDCPSHNLLNFNTKLYERETSRLENLLLKTKDLVNQKKLQTILMLHYPPTNRELQNSKYIDLIQKYNIQIVIFGHIHENYQQCLNKNFNGTTYFLTSADYLNFKPILII